MAKVQQKYNVIIWNECSMAYKYSLEVLNWSLKNFNRNEKIFGGTLILLSGDFKQILPVIPSSTYADEINDCLKSSILWQSVIHYNSQ